MTIIYRETDPVSGRWIGNSGGVDLSAFQIDQNFYEAISRIATLEANESFTVSIAYITIIGNELTFHMTDHSLQGPFTIPYQSFVDRGVWQPLTTYAVNDTFNINGTLYLVIFPHISQATFSPGANDGLGHNYYSAMISAPGSSLPTGGAAGMMLTKVDGHDFHVYWKYPVPVGGAAGYYLTKVDGTDFNMHWSPFPSISMESLSDFLYTSPHSIGQVVQWTGSKWQNATLSVTFSEISDILLTSPHSINQVLQWNGSHWENAFVMVEQLSDVTITSIAQGHALTWDVATSKWLNTAVQPFDAQLFSNVPQNSQNADYTTILTDGEKHIFHPASDVTARTYTIDSNAHVPYPIGTCITFVNQHGAGIITIAITTDTMRLAGAGTTGSRSLAADGIATALKITATEWIISGSGLT